MWTQDQQHAFEEIKLLLTIPPVLAIFDPKRQIKLHIDASKIGIAGILIQDGHPVEYFSRRLNINQENYSSPELECLAVVESVEHYEVYLTGTTKSFTIISDHEVLEGIFMRSKLKSIYFRWAMRLSSYNFIIKHRSGKYMQYDALSRNPIAMSITSLVLFLSNDEILLAQKSTSSIPEKVKKIGQALIFKRHGVRKTFIPKELVPNLLIKAHDKLGHPGFTKTFNMIKFNYWWPTMYRDVSDFCKTCHYCQLAKSVL